MTEEKILFYKKLGLKLTPQRLAILEFLEGNTSHPSAEDIYRALKKNFPSISFATVYNTLELLVRKGFIKELNIESSRKRFDPLTHPHHHFFCKRCRKIVDVNQKIDIPIPEELKDYDVEEFQVVFYGLCPDCKS
ncbi:MAG: transcriptional repressor [Thermodesulfobacteria bacterium]|nr:transcriptional repressor [Thermodesulfobacteriota bacterium]